MPPTYPAVHIKIRLFLRGLVSSNMSPNLRLAIRMTLSRILGIPLKRIGSMSYEDARRKRYLAAVDDGAVYATARAAGAGARVLDESGVSIEMDVTTDTEEIMEAADHSNDDNSGSGDNDDNSSGDSDSLLDTSAAVASVTSQVNEAAASGELEAAMTESVEDVAQEYGDSTLVGAVANVTVDPTRIEMTDFSPTPAPTAIDLVSSSGEGEALPIVAIAATGGAALLLGALAYLFYNYRENEAIKRSRRKTLNSVSSVSGDGSDHTREDDIESRFHDFSRVSPAKVRSPGSARSSGSGSPLSFKSIMQYPPSPTSPASLPSRATFHSKVRRVVVSCEAEDEERAIGSPDTPPAKRGSLSLPRFAVTLSPSFLASPNSGDKEPPDRDGREAERALGGADPLTPEAYATPINIRNKNNRRSSKARNGPKQFQTQKVKMNAAGEMIATSGGVKGGKKPKVVVGLPPSSKKAPKTPKGSRRSSSKKDVFGGEIMVDEAAYSLI